MVGVVMVGSGVVGDGMVVVVSDGGVVVGGGVMVVGEGVVLGGGVVVSGGGVMVVGEGVVLGGGVMVSGGGVVVVEPIGGVSVEAADIELVTIPEESKSVNIYFLIQ